MDEKAGEAIFIGDYYTPEKYRYECYFHPREISALAIGPVPPEGDRVGIAYQVDARDIQEARKRLQVLIGPGHFIGI